MQASVEQRKPGRRFIAMGVLIVLVAAGVLGWTVTSSRTRDGSVSLREPVQMQMGSPMPPASLPYESAEAAKSAPIAYGDEMGRATEDFAVSTSSGGGVFAADVASQAPAGGPTATVGPRVIKTADLSLILEDNDFTDSFDRASLVAAKFDGFVVDSFTEGTHAKAGSLTIRVPVINYDAALSELRDIGTEIERENSSGVDVTDQFVDLNARLRSWEAQQRVLLKLMDRANSIPETMQVQNEIQRVQYEIESIRGQLRVMRDQTSLATITVSMHERGAAAPKGDTDRPSLAVAFDAAIAGFLGVISMVIVGLGYLLPLLVLAIIGWLVWRRVRRAPTTA